MGHNNRFLGSTAPRRPNHPPLTEAVLIGTLNDLVMRLCHVHTRIEIFSGPPAQCFSCPSPTQIGAVRRLPKDSCLGLALRRNGQKRIFQRPSEACLNLQAQLHTMSRIPAHQRRPTSLFCGPWLCSSFSCPETIALEPHYRTPRCSFHDSGSLWAAPQLQRQWFPYR